MPAPVEFYFDFSSPYGYFATERIDAIAARHGREVEWRPVLLGLVFKVSGGQPLPGLPLKGDYFRRDLVRCGRLHGLPVKVPSIFPIATQAPCRAFYRTRDRDREQAKRLVRAVYRAYFEDDRDIANPAVIADLAAEIGIDRNEMTAALSDPAVKERPRIETEGAIAKGVFGSPFVIVDGEPFWGADRLDQVERWLATGGW